MNSFGWLLSRVTMAAILPLCLGVHGSAADAPSLPEEAILNRVHAFTGLDTMFEVDSIENVPALTAKIPFLENALDGETAIQVTFKRGRLKLKSVAADVRDKYDDRQFVVLLDAEAKNLLSITSTTSKNDPDIHHESLEHREAALRGYAESYDSFPTSDPKITFLDALQAIQKDGVGRPLLSREIEGFYVIHSELQLRLNSELYRVTSAKWIISLRGGPPVIPHGPGPLAHVQSAPKPAPIWALNRTREFVDAMSGKWLSADNFP